MFDEAMIKAVLASVFSKPIGGGSSPAQTSQGGNGQLGAAQGIPQGAIGAAVPQSGHTGTQAPQLGPSGASGAQAAPNAAGGQGAPAGGGLQALMPLLQMLGPLLLHLLGGMSGGGGAPAPTQHQAPALGPQR